LLIQIRLLAGNLFTDPKSIFATNLRQSFMRSFSFSKIFAKQEWQLSAAIVSIYLPIRIFVSNNTIDLEIFLSKAPLWFMELSVNLVFFRVWIAVVQSIQRSSDWLDDTFRFKFPRRLFTYVLGLILAILFNLVFISLWRTTRAILEDQFNMSIKRTEQPGGSFNPQQLHKANTALTIMAMLATIYMVSMRRSNQRLEEVRMTAARLEKENLQSQFLALKSQLSPHFLFNSLSILTSLIEKDPQKSVLYVNQLSKSYRYILDQSNLEFVTLKTELDFIETYVFLLKARFEDKLEVLVRIPDLAQNRYKIAPLTLQLLIENAVKHNQMSLENPFHIIIEMAGMYLVVSNPMRKRKGVPASAEVGLPNIIRRYGLLTKEPVLISATDENFTVKIPLLT